MGIIRGSNRSDTLSGKSGKDIIFGRSGNDTLQGGAGSDTIFGGSGKDTAVYGGSVDAISIRQFKGGVLQVKGPEGTDLLKSVEFIRIGGQTYSMKDPIARTDRASLSENQRIEINVLSNDQLLSKGALKIQKLGGGNAKVGDTVAIVDGIEVKLGKGNKLVIDSGSTYDTLSSGETLQREFTYAVGNGSGQVATATVKLTIKGKNDSPVAVSDAVSTAAGVPLAIATADLLANDTDIDRLDVLEVSTVAATADTHGTVTLENGRITYTPEAGYGGPASFIYTTSDGKGGTATAAVNVTVTPADGNAVPDTTSVTATTAEDTAVAIVLAGADADGSVASFAIKSPPGGGGLFLDEAGTQPVDPSNIPAGPNGSTTVWFVPAADSFGTVSFEYAAVDDDGVQDQSPATVAIEVTPVDDDPPLITSDGGGDTAEISMPENGLVVATIEVADPDEPEDTAPSIAAVAALARWATYSLEGPDASLFSISESGELAFLAAPDFENPTDSDRDNVYQVTVRVTDRTGRSDTQDISVTITNVPGATLTGDPSGAPTMDTLVGTDEEDVIRGLAMADVLRGLGGNDLIEGGTGADLLDGGEDDDILIGDAGFDTLIGGAGNDHLNGGDGEDRLDGGDGDDVMIGGNGVDTFVGGRGDDSMTGGSGQDWLDYGAGEANLRAEGETNLRGVEVNLLGVDHPDDLLPHDTAIDTTGDIDQVVEIRNVNGTSMNDWIRGGGQANTLLGNDGDDILRGRGDDDTIDGGAGDDTAEYSGNWSDYRITQNADGSLTVQDLRPGDNLTTDGTDTVLNVENFSFADGIRNLDTILTPEDDGFDFTLTISDPNGLASAQHDAILANMNAAIGNWARYISGDGVIDLEIVVTDGVGTASASSVTNTAIGLLNGYVIFRDSVPHELITGQDLNGAEPDARVFVPAGYLTNELWLDPTPTGNVEPVPVNRTDAVSVFMHEFGHVLGMNGFGAPDGALTGSDASVYDSFVSFEGGNPVFTGPTTVAVYGGPLPLSNPFQGDLNTYVHYGHETSDGLDDNLMEGNTFYMRGFRYEIEQIDLAIMKDLGLNVGNAWLIA